jgi:hypothetical protein
MTALMTRPWSEIEDRYAGLTELGAAFASMLRLVRQIRASRYAHGLHAWTSMHDLCITQQPVSHPYWGPHLRISPVQDGHIELRYIDTYVEEGQWHRLVDGDKAFGRLEQFLDRLRWFSRVPGVEPGRTDR